MRRLLVPLAAALVFAPAAAAKGDNAAIVIGPNGTALVEPYEVVAPVLAQLAPMQAPSSPYALVYLQRKLLPAAPPGRWFPRVAVYCDARNRCVHATELLGSFGSGRITGLFRGAPPRLASLTRDGAALPVGGALGLAVELAFGQAGSSSTAAKPVGCVELRARWRGSSAKARPTAFCIGMSGGVYARGRQYPLYSGIAARLIH
jgi:hypothetical protein